MKNKIKVKVLNILDYYTTRENAYRAEAWFTIGLHKYYTEFLTNLSVGDDFVPIAFLEGWGQKLPKDKEMQEKVRIEIYGELCKLLGKWEVEAFLRKQEQKRREEERKKKEEEEKKTIKIGEQVTFEKWLANEKK